MNNNDMRKVHVAAADLESVEYERDHVAMDLDDAVSTAMDNGETMEDVAGAADMSPDEVTRAQHGTNRQSLESADDS